MKLLRCLLALVAAAVLFAGCGEGGGAETGEERPRAPEGTRTLSLAIDGAPGPEVAGVLVAYERGYFADAGIDAAITTPLTPSRPLSYVLNGSVDVGISHQPQVVMAQEKGAGVVAFGTLVPEPTMSMIWLKGSRIGGISDLKGKTVAVPGVPFQTSFLEAVLRRAGLTLDDVKLERVEHDLVPALVSGRADAVFGGSWNVEGAELQARGLQPVVTRVQDLGVPPYDELVLVARRYRLSKEPELFRRVMAAVRRGTAAAIADPEAATRAIVDERYAESYPENRKAIRAGVEKTLPLLSRTGDTRPGQADRLVDWMYEQGLISSRSLR
ncbi:MAG TPA: ABC transporter substrate-binding protein [Solirubrobacterales bacterium]|nr:ABC transporter substrate-binding protein [Solirubrobacterales bacterium]